MEMQILVYTATYIGLFATFLFILSVRDRSRKIIPKFEELYANKKPPMVSIIIPALNEEKGAANTIKSALGVDYPRDRLEIIFVDDGSKDNTYKIAKRFEGKNVRVFTKPNGGKGTALNFGLKKAKGEIIFTMDADSMVTPNAVKNQIVFFDNPKVMCVAPLLAVYKPRGFLKRIQQIEYMMGIYLREVFTSLNAANVTPGAFSAYRKIFFDKHGGFDEHNIVEDLEIALRIQYYNYILENCTTAVVYTETPKTFVSLLKQRRRWYTGLLRNLWNYTELFSRKYGALGMVILPLALISVLIAMSVTSYTFIKLIQSVREEFFLLESINFNFFSVAEFSKYSVSRFFYSFFSEPLSLFTIMFLLVILGYMFFAKRRLKEHSSIFLGFPIFMICYSFFYVFWWAVSIVYALFNRRVSWR